MSVSEFRGVAQTPNYVLADARAELDRLREKTTTLDAEIEALTKKADEAAISDTLGEKNASAGVVEIEAKRASLRTRRAARK